MQAELPPQEFQAQVLAELRRLDTEFRNLNNRLDSLENRMSSLENRLDTELREIKEQLSRIRFEMEISQKTGERLERLATSLIAGATIAVIAGVILSVIRTL
ncbi:MAG: hypothetical protein RMI89_10185 [Gloeomargarita sp. SKYBB_i_bin120]|nr:hypothetical protein [Gloeomargarita sp. SKYG98]MCS7293319.1 hypothetical protein [Gloeomargarita sp. SKYB120]MDW8178884.1 hypothetical protein [Gloeomargarita sp. SKYBB_i_bin120]